MRRTVCVGTGPSARTARNAARPSTSNGVSSTRWTWGSRDRSPSSPGRGWRAVQVVAAVAGDDEDPLPAHPAQQVAQQVPGRRVRPVQVLQDEDDRVVGGHRRDVARDGLEQLHPAHLDGRGVTHGVVAGVARPGPSRRVAPRGPAAWRARRGPRRRWRRGGRRRPPRRRGRAARPRRSRRSGRRSTVAPVRAARSAKASSRRVLPAPASPARRTALGRPSRAASSAAVSSASSRSRPTRGACRLIRDTCPSWQREPTAASTTGRHRPPEPRWLRRLRPRGSGRRARRRGDGGRRPTSA